MKEKHLSEQFCLGILSLDLPRKKALASLVLSLSSYLEANSVVELSLSPVFHHQYSSIFKCIHDLHIGDKSETNYENQSKKVLDYCLKYGKAQKRIRLQTDVTPLFREHSPSLQDRQYVKKSNIVIKGNKPIGVGYALSSINLSCECKWSNPLLRNRVPLTQTESSFAVEQLQGLLPKLKKALGCDLVINTTDCAYTHAGYLSPLYEEADLICISRLRYGSKVYTCFEPNLEPNEVKQSKSGAPKIYDKCFYLRSDTRTIEGTATRTGKAYEKEQISIYELVHDEHLTLEAKTQKDRALRIELYRWKDLKIRSKKGHCMKHKPFDVVAVKVFDAHTNKRVFKRDLFFTIFGKRKQEVTLEEAYWDYRSRYGIEPSFRFNKQNLFLQDYLCENVQHLDNFLLINQLANWLLYVAASEVKFIPKKWEKKAKKQVQDGEKLSIEKTRRAAQTLFLTFDQTPFLPKSTKKGKGRIKRKTKHYPVVKKTKKRKKKE